MSCVERIKWVLAVLFVLASCILFLMAYSLPRIQSSDFWKFMRHRLNPEQPLDLPQATGLNRCPQAPFVVPTGGWVGVMYGDSILGTVNHSGLDIFGSEENGIIPVYAAYDGYVYRDDDWVSAVVIRHPDDPVVPGRQIWTYYAHMADRAGNSYIIKEIPPGTRELEIKQGTLLGYQGDYNGNSWRTISTHLHFSIILSKENGQFLNETDISNTIDPSPYLGMRLNVECADRPPTCRRDFRCPIGITG